jgi:hypothetical protein
MTSEGLVEMFECDSADTCGEKISLMGGRVEGFGCADQGANTPISMSEIFSICCSSHTYLSNMSLAFVLSSLLQVARLSSSCMTEVAPSLAPTHNRRPDLWI